MEKLPEELQELWDDAQFKEFLENIHKISKDLASKVSTNYSKKEMVSKETVKAALPLLQKLCKYEDSKIHQYIQNIYWQLHATSM